MDSYRNEHIKNRYLQDVKEYYGIVRYTNLTGWNDYYIGNNLIFSHRKTNYEMSVFPEKLHSHLFYEMDIYYNGDVAYISEQQEFTPQTNDILIFPPSTFHTARLIEKSLYERYVFYFSSKVFRHFDSDYIPEVFSRNNAGCFSINRESRGKYFFLIEEIKNAVQSEKPECGLLAYSYFLQLITLIATDSRVNRDSITSIPQKVLEIKEYIDNNFRSISWVSDVAVHFFYSREYVSRMFKQFYNINISEYIVNRKIAFAKELLEEGHSVSYSSDVSGFKSLSSFNEAFRSRLGVSPSKYKRAFRTKK